MQTHSSLPGSFVVVFLVRPADSGMRLQIGCNWTKLGQIGPSGGFTVGLDFEFNRDCSKFEIEPQLLAKSPFGDWSRTNTPIADGRSEDKE